MALVFTSVSQEVRDAGVKMLVYGPAGMGKTVLSATLPRPVLISAESGTLSLRKQNLERLFGVGNPNITYDMPLILVNDIDDLTQAYDWCRMSAEAQAFDSIALDSISEIAEKVLSNAKKHVKDPRQAYGELQDKLEMTVRAFRDLPGKHVYMAAKQGSIKDEFTGVSKYGPMMPSGRSSAAMPYFYDFVGALRVGRNPDNTEYRFIQTQPDLQYEAKDRSGCLDVAEYPHLGNMIAKIRASQ